MDNLSDKLNFASNLEAEGNYLHAVQIYQKILLVEENRKVILRLANLYEKMNHSEKVISMISEYLQNNPNDFEVKEVFAQFLLRINKPEYLISNYLDDDISPMLTYYCAIAYLKLKDNENALLYFKKVIEMKVENEYLIKSYFILIELQIQNQDFSNSLVNLQILEKKSDNLAEVYFLFTKVYFLKNQFYFAQDFWQKAKNNGCNKAEFLYLGGKIHLELKQYEEAEKWFELYLKYKKNNSEIFSLLSYTNYRLENFEKAEKYLEKALKIDPNNKTANQLKNQLINF